MTQGFSLTQNQTQVQKLTPQQQLAISILPYTTQQLLQTVRQAVEENPVLEYTENIEISSGNPTEDVLAKETSAGSDMPPDAFDDADFEERSSGKSMDSDDDKRRKYMFDSLTSQKSLQDMLVEQLNDVVSEDDAPELYRACMEVLGNIDDKGWLCASDEEIAAGANVDADTVEKAVNIIRAFEPAGIGGRSLREVLMLQLERKNEKGSIAWDILDRFYEDILHNRIPQIAKGVDADVSEVQDAIQHIRELVFYPGQELASTGANAVYPDVNILYNENKELEVSLVEYAYPSVSISEKYEQMVKDVKQKPEVKEYLKSYIDKGNALISSLEYRKSTIENIATAILKLQRPFFEQGPEALKPMTLKTIAEEIGVHESTVSRASANKYMRTPFGLFPFSHFFSSAVSTSGEGDVSSRAVRLKIVDYVKHENPQKPLSDQKITEMLAAEGYNVARRTVAKYRELEGIQGTSLRKKHV